jgi:hypothetical protein
MSLLHPLDQQGSQQEQLLQLEKQYLSLQLQQEQQLEKLGKLQGKEVSSVLQMSTLGFLIFKIKQSRMFLEHTLRLLLRERDRAEKREKIMMRHLLVEELATLPSWILLLLLSLPQLLLLPLSLEWWSSLLLLFLSMSSALTKVKMRGSMDL